MSQHWAQLLLTQLLVLVLSMCSPAALSDLSFSIRGGSRVGVVGRTGTR